MKKNSTSIAVIGLGRIGFPSALLAAQYYKTVVGVDQDQTYIGSLKDGTLPFLEAGLSARFLESGLSFTTEIPRADLYLVAIPTLGLSGVFETLAIEKTLLKIDVLSQNAIVIIESTLPIGAVKRLGSQIRSSLVYCPERVAPGNVFDELSTIPRCIASNDPAALEKAKNFFDTLGIQTLETSPETAETVKLAENAFRDANIAFANRLSEICAQNETDVQEVIKIANTHPRVNILKPGLGAGGACLAPSTRTLDSASLFRAVRETNERQIERILKTIQHHKITSVALWGLSYKANCDDIRFSKSMDLKALLEANNIDVKTWDPVAKVGDFKETLETQAIIFGVAHQDFKKADLAQRVRDGSHLKYIIDFVHAIDIAVWNKAGFSCICA